MRALTSFLVTALILMLSAGVSTQSLPPVAQALYDEGFANDPVRGQFSIDSGATVHATPDGNSFYLQWFPAGANPQNTPLIVSLPGSSSYAFDELYLWHHQARLHGCGIIALQWYRGDSSAYPNDYFNDTLVYTFLDSALSAIGYPPGKAFLHGFSRGSARSYAIVFMDIQSGNNYFCTTLSNSGSAEPGYPLYAAITAGAYGPQVYAGKRWALFCGGLDPNPTLSGCIGMTNTQSWLQSQGASVDLFIQDPNLGHGGFHQTDVYIDSVLDYYLLCYTGELAGADAQEENDLVIYPNPFHHNLVVSGIQSTTRAILYNASGTPIASWPIGEKQPDLSGLPAGLYLLNVMEDDGHSSIHKVIKE